MTAYYNEIEPYPAQWLKNLIAAGLIAPGDVDTRSIEEVMSDDVKGYAQVHMFAGLGAWSYALRQAGWADNRPVWSCSCPCQPFSSAGRKKGFDDARHLWPHAFRLISQCRPGTVFGEQVSGKNGLAWLDAVQTDLESCDYAVGALGISAAGVGAPHIRRRLYFVADAEYNGPLTQWKSQGPDGTGRVQQPEGSSPASADVCADAEWDGNRGRGLGAVAAAAAGMQGADGQRERIRADLGPGCATDVDAGSDAHTKRRIWPRVSGKPREADAGIAGTSSTIDASLHANEPRPQGRRLQSGERACQCAAGQAGEAAGDIPHAQGQRRHGSGNPTGPGGRAGSEDGGPLRGFWADAEWLPTIDGRWMPAQPGIFPMVAGTTPDMGCNSPGEASPYRAIYVDGRPVGQAPWRIGMLKAYGNSLCAETAIEFVKAYIECRP